MSIKKRCKNCKYYKSTEKPRGECSNKNYIYTEDLTWQEYDKAKKYDDTLNYWDYESYMAGFNVGENFGCIHFKKREVV